MGRTFSGRGLLLAVLIVGAIAAPEAAWTQVPPAPSPAPTQPAGKTAPAPQSRGPQGQVQQGQGQAPAAQSQAAPAADQEAPPPVSAETKAIRAKLDAIKAELDQREATLKRPHLTSADLQALRQQLDPLADNARAIIASLAPRLDAAKARLDQLGPKPKEGAPEESADVARDRAEREAAAAEIDETQRLARALQVQAEQLITQASDRRREVFAQSLLERTSSILSPDLWTSLVRTLPRDAKVVGTVLGDWLDLVRRNASLGAVLLVGLALGIAIALYLGREALAPRLIHRDPGTVEPPRRNRLLAALGTLLLGAGPAVGGSFLVYMALDAANILPARLAPVARSLLFGIAFVAFVRALADAILAPGRGPWRLVRLGDAAAARTAGFAVAIATVIAAGKFLERITQAIAAALPLTVVTRSVFALAAALLLIELLRRFATTSSNEEACLGPYIPTEPEVGGPIRMIGWLAAGAVVASVLVGYVALASFLVDQIVWIGIVLSFLLLGLSVADEFIGGTLGGQTRVATALQANTGLRRRSLDQIAVLLGGFARVILILATLLLILAPWGVDSTDLFSSVRTAFFGFRVGDVTISPSAIVLALLLFALVFVVTRVVQRWLDRTFLPATDLDAGLRNSIVTVVGYVGVFSAAAVAFSYLGLSLDKIAIVAGALSVGIGFGLQSIVNNFVSGLILLWERPIRVGDLVVVGDGEGHVRKISVRATEIETFDRSTIIVPNSNLISGIVKNRVRGDRTGRVTITVNVLRNQDPARAAELLTSCARDHADVLENPAPKVYFKKIGETWLEFELICFVGDVNNQAKVQSELNFAAFRCLNEASIIPPLGPASMNVQGLTQVEAALEHIAQAIGQGPRPEEPREDAPEPAAPEPLPRKRKSAGAGD